MKLTNHEINAAYNINIVCEKFSLQLKQVYKKIHAINYKINADIDQRINFIIR